LGLAQAAVAAIVGRSAPGPLGASSNSAPRIVGVVGHEVDPLPDVRRAEAASRKIDRPDGVIKRFERYENIVEPACPNRSINLLTKDRCRAALADEPMPMRP